MWGHVSKNNTIFSNVNKIFHSVSIAEICLLHRSFYSRIMYLKTFFMLDSEVYSYFSDKNGKNHKNNW